MPPFGKTTVRLALLGTLWVLLAPLAARLLVVRSEPTRADAIIVLSGSAVYAERLQQGVKLYHQGAARKVIITNDGQIGRWSRARQRNPRSIEQGRDILLGSGLPAEALIVLPERVHSTYDEALAAQAYARANRLRSLLIVTSPYHARRALWVFRRVLAADGVSVGIDPAPPGSQSPTPGVWWLSGRGWQSVGAEYPKFLYYLFAYR